MTQKTTAIFGIAVMAAILLGGLAFSQSAFAGVSTGGGPGGGQVKVTLCHVDQETGEEITITVGAPAVPAHLAHGDTLGPCDEEPPPFCEDSPCNDDNECTIDVCIEAEDACTNTPNEGALCGDGGTCDEVGVCVPPSDLTCADCFDQALAEEQLCLDDGGTEEDCQEIAQEFVIECHIICEPLTCDDCLIKADATFLQCVFTGGGQGECLGIAFDVLFACEESIGEICEPITCDDCLSIRATTLAVCLESGTEEECQEVALDVFSACEEAVGEICEPEPSTCEECSIASSEALILCDGDLDCIISVQQEFSECTLTCDGDHNGIPEACFNSLSGGFSNCLDFATTPDELETCEQEYVEQQIDCAANSP